MKSGKPRTAELLAGLAVLPAVLRAAFRVGWHEPSSTLPALAIRLRATRTRLTGRDPASVLPVVEALLPVLPPLGAGRCLKRSLILLDLWSRARLEPALHLGYRGEGTTALEGHAWVTTRGELATHQPADVSEIWSG